MIVNGGAIYRAPAYIPDMDRQEYMRRLLTGLTGLALVGLIVLQGMLLVNAYELKQQAFRRSAEAALNAAARSLEVESTLSQVFLVNRRSDNDSGSSAARWRERNYTYVANSAQRMRLVVHSSGARDSVVFDSVAGPGEVTVPYPDNGAGTGNVMYTFTTDSIVAMTRIEAGGKPALATAPRSAEAQKAIIARVIENIWRSPAAASALPVKPAVLDSVLRATIARSGLPEDLAYGVLSLKGDSLLIANPKEHTADLLRSDLRVPLSLIDPLGPHVTLVAFFPGQDLYLVQQLGLHIAASLLFVAMIAASFVITLRTIGRQRRLTTMLTDFVNTMTHEFKTPISTIALASEAIARPDVAQKKTKIIQYNRVIAEETARMKKQVSRILEMAHLESDESDLSRMPVNLHELVLRASSSFALQVESKGGTLATALEAAECMVSGDAVHLEGVMHNLLDNAVKYSPGAPAITIRSGNTAGRITLMIADRGAGIPAEYQRLVFDKYFRVPQGNRHDVKGFGLGLSYVKLVVGAHGGDVSLESAEGKGTTVIVSLPVIGHESRSEARTPPGR
jgi:two-component system phosphate regulon sensor histidine kinase PhoR